jgi:nucleoside 2-deoxyribosyltransferase
MKKFYLAHNFEIRKKMRKWELKMEGKYNIKLDNPFYDHDRNDIKALDSMEDGGPEQLKYFRERNTDDMVDKIVEGDLELIRKSDGIVTQIKSPSIGTSMEIIMAARIYSIPVYLITKKYGYHPWIKKHATRIFKTRKEFEEFVEAEYGVKK